jgi:mannonate dehydratase
MDRRKFFSLSSASAVAFTAGGAPPSAAATTGLPPLKARLGHQMGEVTDAKLAWLARYGVEGLCASATIADPSRIYANRDEMMRLRESVEKHGMTLDLTDSLLLRSTLIDEERYPSIMLAQSPQRDRDIESFQNHIRAAAAAGIPGVKYNMSILGVVRSGSTPGRGDALYATWRLKDAPPNQPLTRAGLVNADAAWERIAYFLERVVPVANE